MILSGTALLRQASIQSKGASHKLVQRIQSRKMSSTMADLGIENTDVKTAEGVTLDEGEKVIVCSVLDLFAGRPSLKKLQLWKDDAVFGDPITIAKGRKQFEAQWYGLQAAFSDIERLSHSVTSSGNPIKMDLRTKYKVKGVGSEHTIDSVLNIYYDRAAGKIEKVEDRWNNELPDGAFKNAFRKLNAVTVPTMVGAPKTEAEDAKKGN